MTTRSWFSGEVALVTGGGAGIGRAIALAFAAHGAKVAVADHNLLSATETVALVQAAGGVALAVQADVTDAAQVQAMVAQTVAHFGALHFAANNAGIEGDVFAPVADYAEST